MIHDGKTVGTDECFWFTPSLSRQNHDEELPMVSKTAQMPKNRRIISLWEAKRCSNNCRKTEIRPMHPRPAWNSACYSRVCSFCASHDVQIMKDVSSFDTIWMRLIPLWLPQLPCEPSLKMGTTIDLSTRGLAWGTKQDTISSSLNSNGKKLPEFGFVTSLNLDFLVHLSLKIWVCWNRPRSACLKEWHKRPDKSFSKCSLQLTGYGC